jgi:hypothetical protein
MAAAREPDQADFDLERFIDMFDEAMTSKDERVINALRNLMMIVTLTRPEIRMEMGRNTGPLRRLFEDVQHLNRRLYDVEDTIRRSSISKEEKAYQAEAYQAKIAMQASQDIAQHIDQNLINTLKIKAQGLYRK